VQPPVPFDSIWQARIQEAYRLDAAAPWFEPDSTQPLAALIQPLLGEQAEPDPTFFVESWTLGVGAASENYHRRHSVKSPEPLLTPGFPSFSFVAFLNVDAVPAATQAAPQREAEPARKPLMALPPADQDADLFASPPLTLQAACRLLGVTMGSTREQIRAAYRRMAGRYHPDRVECAGSIDSQLASDRMAAINEAYRMLCSASFERTA
jgi:hypothetical protein